MPAREPPRFDCSAGWVIWAVVGVEPLHMASRWLKPVLDTRRFGFPRPIWLNALIRNHAKGSRAGPRAAAHRSTSGFPGQTRQVRRAFTAANVRASKAGVSRFAGLKTCRCLHRQNPVNDNSCIYKGRRDYEYRSLTPEVRQDSSRNHQFPHTCHTLHRGFGIVRIEKPREPEDVGERAAQQKQKQRRCERTPPQSRKRPVHHWQSSCARSISYQGKGST